MVCSDGTKKDEEEESLKNLIGQEVTDMTLDEKKKIIRQAVLGLPFPRTVEEVVASLEKSYEAKVILRGSEFNEFIKQIQAYRSLVQERVGTYLGVTKEMLISSTIEGYKHKSYADLLELDRQEYLQNLTEHMAESD